MHYERKTTGYELNVQTVGVKSIAQLHVTANQIEVSTGQRYLQPNPYILLQEVGCNNGENPVSTTLLYARCSVTVFAPFKGMFVWQQHATNGVHFAIRTRFFALVEVLLFLSGWL